MASPNPRKTPAEVKFRVDPEEKAQADRIAASVGMDTNTAMKVMFKRFVAERGFPFEMKARAPGQGASGEEPTPFGVGVGRLAQIAGAGFADAARRHEKGGRRGQVAVTVSRRTARRR